MKWQFLIIKQQGRCKRSAQGIQTSPMTRLSFTQQVKLTQAGQDHILSGTGCVTKKNSPYQKYFDSKTNYRLGQATAIRNWKVSAETHSAAASIAELNNPLSVWLLLAVGQSSVANLSPVKINANSVFRLFAAANNIAVGKHLSADSLRKRVQYHTGYGSAIDIIFNSNVSHLFNIGKIQGKNCCDIFIQAKAHNHIAEKFATEAVLERKHTQHCYPDWLWKQIPTTEYSQSSKPNKKIKSVIADYMSAVDKKHYRFNAAKRDAGIEYIKRYYLDKNLPSYNHAFGTRMLEQVEMLYKIEKEPVEINHYTGKHNERCFGKGVNLQFMKKELRQILYPSWTDGDMVNCHLAIINQLCNLNLDLSVSIWETIEETLHSIGAGSVWWHLVPHQLKQKNSGLLKSMFKTAVYSIIYGSTFKNVVSGAEKYLKDQIGYIAGPELKQMFQEHGLIEFLYKCINNYKRENYLSNTMFSRQCQKIESTLISEIYKIAQQYTQNEIVIVVHSHDGVTFKAGNDRLKEEFSQKCSAAIAAAAAKLDISMAWVIKDAPTHVAINVPTSGGIMLCCVSNLNTALSANSNNINSIPIVKANLQTVRKILLWRY